jgi:N-methylhydantoinase A
VRDVYFDGKFLPARLYRRDQLKPGDTIRGPAMITEYTSATVLPPECRAEVDRFGNLVVTFSEESK